MPAVVETRVRRETGKEQVVQVHYDEGVANHIGPEPCAGNRKDVGEASAGERAGQPLSRDRKRILGADAVCVAEGNMPKSANASAWATWRGRRTWHACMHALCTGTAAPNIGRRHSPCDKRSCESPQEGANF
jgi:hypothetical protein